MLKKSATMQLPNLITYIKHLFFFALQTQFYPSTVHTVH